MPEEGGQSAETVEPIGACDAAVPGASEGVSERELFGYADGIQATLFRKDFHTRP